MWSDQLGTWTTHDGAYFWDDLTSVWLPNETQHHSEEASTEDCTDCDDEDCADCDDDSDCADCDDEDCSDCDDDSADTTAEEEEEHVWNEELGSWISSDFSSYWDEYELAWLPIEDLVGDEPVVKVIPDFYDPALDHLVMDVGQEDIWWDELGERKPRDRLSSGEGLEKIVCESPDLMCVVAFIPVTGTKIEEKREKTDEALIDLASYWGNFNKKVYKLDIGTNPDAERLLHLPINKTSLIAFKANEDFYY